MAPKNSKRHRSHVYEHPHLRLFEEVFAKPPIKVLEEAIAAALEEIGHPQLELPSDLSVEQANLALRRRAMKVQCSSPRSKLSTGIGPRSSDEFTRFCSISWRTWTLTNVRTNMPCVVEFIHPGC